MKKRFESFIASQYEFLNEARKENVDVKYKKMKGGGKKEATDSNDVKVILAELSGNESGVITKWATELDEADKEFIKAKKALDTLKDKAIDVDNQFFDDADGIYLRMIKTAKYTVKFSKYQKTEEEKADTEYKLKDFDTVKSIMKEIQELISKQVPKLKDQVMTLSESIFEIKESKEVRKFLGVAPLEEGIVDSTKEALKSVTKYVNSTLNAAFKKIKSFFVSNDKDSEKIEKQLDQLDKILSSTKKKEDKK